MSSYGLPGQPYKGYMIDMHDKRTLTFRDFQNKYPFKEDSSTRHVGDLMHSPPDRTSPCLSPAGKRSGEWWKLPDPPENKARLMEFGVFHGDYVEKRKNDSPYGAIRKNGPSYQDLIMSKFIQYWLGGPKCLAGGSFSDSEEMYSDSYSDSDEEIGMLGSERYSDFMRLHPLKGPYDGHEEQVVAKGLELFFSWKEDLASQNDIVLYRALPRRFVGEKDQSFLSVASFDVAVRYRTNCNGVPVKHTESQAVIAQILIPKGTPIIKVNNKGRQEIEYILPPGHLCLAGNEYAKSFGTKTVNVQPVVYVPSKRFITFSYIASQRHKAVSPKAVSPKAVSPKAISPKAVSPKAVSPKAVSPKAVLATEQERQSKKRNKVIEYMALDISAIKQLSEYKALPATIGKSKLTKPYLVMAIVDSMYPN